MYREKANTFDMYKFVKRRLNYLITENTSNKKVTFYIAYIVNTTEE